MTGTTLTVSGTGIAGRSVLVFILPNDAATLTAVGSVDPLALSPSTVVLPDGSWSVTTTLSFGTYGLAAVHTTTPPTAVDAEPLSETSNQVLVTLAAPVVIAPAELAATGSVNSDLAIPAGLLVVVGALLHLTVSRRRSENVDQRPGQSPLETVSAGSPAALVPARQRCVAHGRINW